MMSFNGAPQDVPQNVPQNYPQGFPQNTPNQFPQNVPQNTPNEFPQEVPQGNPPDYPYDRPFDMPSYDNETFYELGPSLRVKRGIAFPVDDKMEQDDKIGEEENSVEVVGASDGRALKQTIQSVTKIDVGIQSQLLVAPGSTSIIYFDVTNLRNEPTYHNFNVQDEKRYLRAMEPRFLWLQPNQKESVRVTVVIPQGAELGTKDKITLTSLGTVQTSQSVVVTIATNGVNDPWAPNVWYTYNTRCDWRQSCVGGTWSVEVVARDYESGLMSLRSNPEGLLLRAPFTAGTNDEVKATYSASCCEPRVSITAYDLNRNQRSIQLNVDEPWLSEYAIATVVLAVLFFILLIVLIVIWVVWCCKRRRASRDLPTYRPGDIRPRP